MDLSEEAERAYFGIRFYGINGDARRCCAFAKQKFEENGAGKFVLGPKRVYRNVTNRRRMRVIRPKSVKISVYTRALRTVGHTCASARSDR